MCVLKGVFRGQKEFAFLAILLLLWAAVVSCETATSSAAGSSSSLSGTIRITGAGALYPALSVVAQAFEKKNPGTRVDFLTNNQTSGGIRGVKDGIVAIGSVTRPPTAEEAEGRLRYAEFAKDALMLAAHPSVVGVTNLRGEDVRAVYGGQVRNWKELGGPDAEIVVLDRPEDDSSKILLRQYVLGPEFFVSPSTIVLPFEPDLIKSMKETPYSVGPLSLASAKKDGRGLVGLNLDGVAPSPENVAAEQYRMARTLGIVWMDNIPAHARAFRDFLLSDEAGKLLWDNQYLPTNGVLK